MGGMGKYLPNFRSSGTMNEDLASTDAFKAQSQMSAIKPRFTFVSPSLTAPLPEIAWGSPAECGRSVTRLVISPSNTAFVLLRYGCSKRASNADRSSLK